MDKKYNSNWIVAIGQGFSFEVTHEVKHVLWMYFNNCAILVYKGAPATSHIYADAPPPGRRVAIRAPLCMRVLTPCRASRVRSWCAAGRRLSAVARVGRTRLTRHVAAVSPPGTPRCERSSASSVRVVYSLQTGPSIVFALTL